MRRLRRHASLTSSSNASASHRRQIASPKIQAIRTALTLILALLLSLAGSAQSAGTRITGKVANAEGKALEAATVSPLRHPDKKMIKLAVSNGKGEFELLTAVPGTYLLQVSATGYQTVLSDSFII